MDTELKVGDKVVQITSNTTCFTVDRASGSYTFPGTVVSLFVNSEGIEYATVEMDTHRLLHIFRVGALKKVA